MSRLTELVRRIRALGAHEKLDREFDAERDSHLQLAADDYERQGLGASEARRQARLAFGSTDAALETQRDARSLPRVESLVRDAGYGWRRLRRQPGLTAVVVLILAVGIGANTAVFSLVQPVLLKPLPFDRPESLVWIANTGTAGLSGATYQVDTFEALSRQSQTVGDWTAYFAFFGYGNDTLTGHGDPERVTIVDVAPRFFDVLGVGPARGRLFLPAEHVPNGPDVVLIGHQYWARRFASDPTVVGAYLTINGRPALVAGVLPASFDFGSVFAPGTRVDFFKPAVLDNMRPWGNTLSVIARLRPGASVNSAQQELDVIATSTAAATPTLNRFGVRVSLLQTRVSGAMQRPLLVLWGAVGLVLLLVCVNVSNLLLAQSTARAKEFAVRLALGAARGRIFQQMAIEGVLLASLGAALGIPLAIALTTVVKQNATQAVPLLHQAGVDTRALIVTAALALGTGLLFSVLPGLRLSRTSPQSGLVEQSRGTTADRRHAWMRSSMVVVQITIACVLLIGTGLLLRSLVTLLEADFGFHPAGSTIISLKVGPDRTVEQRAAAFTEAARRVRAMPVVDAAGLTDALPLDRNRSWSVGVPGRTYQPGERPVAFGYVIGPGYFSAMGIALTAGRDVAETDTLKTPPVVVVSQSLARALYSTGDPIGRAVQFRRDTLTIVGVVADVRQSSLDEAGALQMYLAGTQGAGNPGDLVVRSSMDSAAFVTRLRQDFTAIDPTLIITGVRPVADLVERSVSPRRFLVSLLSGFSIFAVLLACLGIYGVVSFGVSQRVQEIGVRMALGATAGDVRRHVLSGTVRLATIGIAAGLLASLALGQVIGALLYGTSTTDLITYVWTVGLLLAVACVAGYLPALRAARIKPMRALQS